MGAVDASGSALHILFYHCGKSPDQSRAIRFRARQRLKRQDRLVSASNLLPH
jgi:hypothetical protein